MKSFAIALAGGGAKGAYQVGALKAISEMGIDVCAVAGTSIGSINGAIFAQGDIDKAYELWHGISIEKVISLSEEFYNNEKSFNIKSILDFSKSVFSNKGIDVTPLREMLTEYVDENRIRTSEIDFGLTTVSITDRRPVEIFKSSIPSGRLVDYLLASSCFPGFKFVEIDGKRFIDGGVSNNMPVSMLIGRGYKDIIAIDIGGLGIVKNVDTSGINIKTIKNNERTIGTFEFNKDKIEKSIKSGLLDTYKVFGRLNGRRYYFENGEYEILKGRYSKAMMTGFEYAATLLLIENRRIYKADEFIDAIIEKYKYVLGIYNNVKGDLHGLNVADLLKNWRSEENLKMGVVLPFLVDLISGDGAPIKNTVLSSIVNKEFIAASGIIYLCNQ